MSGPNGPTEHTDPVHGEHANDLASLRDPSAPDLTTEGEITHSQHGDDLTSGSSQAAGQADPRDTLVPQGTIPTTLRGHSESEAGYNTVDTLSPPAQMEQTQQRAESTALADNEESSKQPVEAHDVGGSVERARDMDSLAMGHSDTPAVVVQGSEIGETAVEAAAEADVKPLLGIARREDEDEPIEPGQKATARENKGLSAREVEEEASQHLASRAAEISLHNDSKESYFLTRHGSISAKDALPATPPPPVPPRKDSMPKKLAPIETQVSEKGSVGADLQGMEIPPAPQDATETTGAEIENIMGQFAEGMGGMGEKEIMSPRLERQQSLLVLPPRSSSLEPKDSFTIHEPTPVQSIQSPLVAQGTGRSAMSKGSVSALRADDQESIKSGTAGSIFQPPPPSPDPEPALPFDFHRFLEQLRHRTADPVARFLRSFLNEFAKKQWMVHEQVKIISDFLEFITKKMGQCEVWRVVSDAEFDNAREGMEKLVMNRLYSQTFSPAIPAAPGSPRRGGRGGKSQSDASNPHGPGRRGQHQEDVERDDVIAQKIRIYGWVNEQHLDINPIGDKGKKFITLAQQELLKINTYRAPRDKVICVLNCCKAIFGFLRSSKSDQSADAFVPLLIYTVLRARPEHLVSNVQYIWRFRNQEKLGGEAGYYMSSLMGVVSFIENLDRTNLTITDQEFERNVEQAVSAIAEKNHAEEYENRSHAVASSASTKLGRRSSEKTTAVRPDVSPRKSADRDRSSQRLMASSRASEKLSLASSGEEDSDTMTGILRSIQKPLSSIGRMFSDEIPHQQQLQPQGSPQPSSTPRRTLSPSPQFAPRRSVDAGDQAQRRLPERRSSQQHDSASQDLAAAGHEAPQARRDGAQEHKLVVETLVNMFPSLDKDVIEDVVRSQDGNVSRAVDACLAMCG